MLGGFGADQPSPWLAALLGLIPGVGAMYNGQFAKGVAHLAIFAVFVSLSNNVNGIFGLFVTGWIFYQSFEAYHTAKARRDGLPLPDPFGLNNIGDRFNFSQGAPWNPPGTVPPNPGPSSGPIPPRPAATAPQAAPGYDPSNAPGSPATSVPPNPYVAPTAPRGSYGFAPGTGQQTADPARSVADAWLGYVPPQAFAGTTPPGNAAYWQPGTGTPAGGPSSDPAAAAPPYRETYYGGFNPVPPMPAAPNRRLPSAAFWLIGLGMLVLLFNLVPGWHLGPSWVAAALLAGFAIWSLLHRINASAESWGNDLTLVPAGQWVHAARVPVVLLTLAVLLAIQGAHWLTLGQSWPVLLVVLGAVLLMERVLPVGPALQDPRFQPGHSGDWAAPYGAPADGRHGSDFERVKDGR